MLEEFRTVLPLMKSSVLVKILVVLTFMPNVVITIINYQFNFAVNEQFATETREVSQFSTIENRGEANVYLTVDDAVDPGTVRLTISGDENLLNDVQAFDQLATTFLTAVSWRVLDVWSDDFTVNWNAGLCAPIRTSPSPSVAPNETCRT